LQQSIELIERIPYSEALAALGAASALLLLQGGDDTRMLIPAKAFEYLRVGRLILTLAPAQSATAHLISGFSGSFVAAPLDPTDIARQLTNLVTTWNQGCRFVERRDSGLARYSRSALAGELARVLGIMTAPATAPTGSLGGREQ
jgi:hypothetical protein